MEIQAEVENLEKPHQNEKARLEYQRKTQIQKEREVARITLEKMEQTVKLNQSLEKEVEDMMKIMSYGSFLRRGYLR